MTAQPTGPDGATPVDRRWFEEALRSQGFVVEPPTDDIESDAGRPVPEVSGPVPTDASPRSEAPELSVATPAVERPPMPSALLARIAARSQPAPVLEPAVATGSGSELIAAPEPDVPEAGPDPAAEAAPSTESAVAPDPTQPLEAERVARWASAVVTPVAPWASTPAPSLAGPEPTRIDEPPPMVEAAGAAAAAAAAVTEDTPIDASEPVPAVEPPVIETQPPAAVTPAVLDTPYPPATVPAAATVPQPRAVAVPAGPAPEASEGELWALVGASEPAAAAAPASEATRVILTILTAFLILVIVVGSLVLASQIA